MPGRKKRPATTPAFNPGKAAKAAAKASCAVVGAPNGRDRSQRIRARKEQEEPSKDPAPTGSRPRLWTDSEKETFLDALKMHGTGDIGKLAQAMKGRTEDQVRAYVRKLKALQGVMRTSEDEKGKRGRFIKPTPAGSSSSPIEAWIGLLEGVPVHVPELMERQARATADAVPTMFQWIADFETHPPVSDPRTSIDYPSIYRALASLMRGDVPPDLNPASAQKLLDLVSDIYCDLKGAADTPELADAARRLRDYSYEGTHSEDRSWEGRRGVPGVNVFNLPESMFEKEFRRQDVESEIVGRVMRPMEDDE